MDIINIAIAEDHSIVRKGLVALLSAYEDLRVLFEAANGDELLEKLEREKVLPNVCLLDISMPVKNGYETLELLKEKYPQIEVMMISQYNEPYAIAKVLRGGAKAFVHKEEDAAVLYDAIRTIVAGGYFQNHLVTEDLLSSIHEKKSFISLNSKELCFLRYTCTDLTYKEIASRMGIGKRTAEGYADALMHKLQLKSRTALAMYALSIGLVSPSNKS